MNNRKEQLAAVERLLDIMDELRLKCPWDAKQTFESLRNLTIEEVYELTDSIDQKDYPELKKELGDVLMHIVFYAKIGSEQNLFDIADIANSVSDKLVYRHPHIYSDVVVADEKEVESNWEKLKLKEGNKSVLGGVPKGLSAMVKAYRIQDKTSGVGFDWQNKEDVWAKFEEEIEEFKVEEVKGDKTQMEDEFGDILFSLVNYARFVKIDPEQALAKANNKFINRFQKLEQLIIKDNKVISDLSAEELNQYWIEVKKIGL
ncbi:nucleoside triphosphate pyrophosphohydrolase [Myroides albus]|uniref:Nucleoside triphosphate pyrophosphohydrolase n=3 Tax=Myroides TaxID=76831 RepID=A0A6I3LGU2_9FLAO|nr:nucleoside triphosphate pyrophosphohydrolase [Myroides albus]MTG97433.1 nucleoside triphosphate pyrophosphohydrolase [Myroides albus]UVD79462.1 nucleoside triphosphate pyrophosphohydrolase [Myroides albus]